MKIKQFEYDFVLKFLPVKNIHIANLLPRNYLISCEENREFYTSDMVHCINHYNTNNG